jgi:hypothetical protein
MEFPEFRGIPGTNGGAVEIGTGVSESRKGPRRAHRFRLPSRLAVRTDIAEPSRNVPSTGRLHAAIATARGRGCGSIGGVCFLVVGKAEIVKAT